MNITAFRDTDKTQVRQRHCLTCGSYDTVRLVDHPAGPVLLCVYCGDVRAASRPRPGRGRLKG